MVSQSDQQDTPQASQAQPMPKYLAMHNREMAYSATLNGTSPITVNNPDTTGNATITTDTTKLPADKPGKKYFMVSRPNQQNTSQAPQAQPMPKYLAVHNREMAYSATLNGTSPITVNNPDTTGNATITTDTTKLPADKPDDNNVGSDDADALSDKNDGLGAGIPAERSVGK